MKRAPVGQGVALGALVACTLGCASPAPEADRLAESIVITKHASDVNFQEYKTYYLRPEIRTLDEDGELEPIDPTKAQPLLNATTNNLEARGFQAVEKQDADLGVEIVYVEHINTAYWCYSWWSPYYWGYPYWYYYPYYGGCDATVWKSGMLATMITDLTDARANPNPPGGGGEAGAGGGGGGGNIDNRVPGIWFSGVYGTSPTTSGAVDGINQAFKQSPYVKAGE